MCFYEYFMNILSDTEAVLAYHVQTERQCGSSKQSQNASIIISAEKNSVVTDTGLV